MRSRAVYGIILLIVALIGWVFLYRRWSRLLTTKSAVSKTVPDRKNATDAGDKDSIVMDWVRSHCVVVLHDVMATVETDDKACVIFQGDSHYRTTFSIKITKVKKPAASPPKSSK